MKLYLNNFKKSVFYRKLYLLNNPKKSNSTSISNLKNSNIYLFWRKLYFLKNVTFYLILHPQKIPKCIYILIFYGPSELINKYTIAQKRDQQNIHTKHHYPMIFSILFYKIKRKFSQPWKLIKRVIISLFYFILIAIFFIISSIAKLISSLFVRKISIKNSETNIDGVSFIIPTWNKKDMLLTCIKLLDLHLSQEKPDIPKEIIVVENGSTDGSVEAVSNLKTRIPVVLLPQPTNLGFAKAINLGLKHSKYNYVYLINNDMEPQPNFFNSLIDFTQNLLKQNQKFFGNPFQIFFFDPTKRREESGKTYILPNLGYISVAHYVQEAALKTSSITLYPGGGSSLINKHYLQKFGGYDYKTYTPLYCEDLDAGFVAWKLGLTSYFVPESHIIHHHRSSSTRLIQDPGYFMYKNWLVLILKNFDSPQNIFRHLFLYPGRIILSESHSKYAVEALKNLQNIFISKIKLYKYKTINSDYSLINFPKFETKLK